MAALTDQDKERVRYHTGYLETSFAASLQFGIPRPVQTIFLLEDAMSLLVNPYAVDRVRCILDILDDIERRLTQAYRFLQVGKIGEITLRGPEPGKSGPDLLEREYKRWAQRLADIFGVPLYPYSARFRNVGPGMAPRAR